MRKRTTSPKETSTSRPSGGGAKPFRKSNDGPGHPFKKVRPEAESRFSKPSIKRSSFRAATADSKEAGKPGFEKPKSDRPDFERPRFEKPRFDKPRFDKPSFSKPASEKPSDRPRRSDREGDKREGNRELSPRERFNKEGADKPRFERPASNRPTRDGESRGFKPRSEAGGEREPRPRREFSQDGSENRTRSAGYDRERPSRDVKPSGERTFGTRSRDDKPGFKKKSEPEKLDTKSNDATDNQGADRRVGHFETAPRYNFSGYEKKAGIKKKTESPEMRLNRYIANAGICSRREADELISSGQISVNEKTITEMGYKVMPTDVVKYGKKPLNREKLVYILINKPKDYITTTEDPEERKTVLDLIQGACFERVYPVGRLDRNTTGLLLLTNDGELAGKLTHPSSNVKKIYQAELDRPITTEDFEKLQHGLELEDGFIRPDEIGIVTPDAMVVGLEIHSGRNRIVRRMFEHLGYEVQKLDRTVFAGLNKKELPRGKWRFLNEKEVIKLKYML